MKISLLRHIGSLSSLALAVLTTATTIAMGNTSASQVWADVIEGTENNDFIVGTPEDDIIDSKGGRDTNFGDNMVRDGSGDDVIISGDNDGVAPEFNYGDSSFGDGSGDDVIISGEGKDQNNGDTFWEDGSGDDVIISGEGKDQNNGDTIWGHGSGDDVIISGEGNDENLGDTGPGTGSGDDVIISGEGNDYNFGGGGRDIFVCGDGEDTIESFGESSDIATPDCENV